MQTTVNNVMTELTVEEKLGNTGGATTVKEFKRQRGRMCKVQLTEFDGKARVQVTRAATFHCWGLRSAKAEDSGPKQMPFAETIAIVELADGKVKQVRPERVNFTDRTP